MMASTPATVGRIMINYRRQETAYAAGRLFDRLSDKFGVGQVFMDVDTIELGMDFVEAITAAVASCEVQLVLIGDQWLTITGSDGRRRVDDPEDFVRLELEAALVRDVLVIPVLVDGAPMPSADELPSSLAGLVRRQALELRPTYFDTDFKRLFDVLERALTKAQVPPERDAREDTDRHAGEQRGNVKEEAHGKQETSDQIEQGADVAAASVTGVEGTRETRIQAAPFERPKIFLCYRREDTQWPAGRIYDNLASKYGQEQVFRDIDSTRAGIKYSAWIESKVSQSSVMIVLIGNAWLSAKDPAGQRRLDSPRDWVRREIEAALRHDIPIIPVRIQEARLPSEEELPPSIADLLEFQDAEVTDRRWAYDVGQLIQAIDGLHAPEHGAPEA
jgi:hypothetical protein